LKLSATAVLNSTIATAAHEQLDYLSEVNHLDASSLPPNMLTFWQQRSATYNLLFPVAEDLLCAPASQAFVERIFSICGVLYCGHRSSMHKSLKMRACLKLNAQLLTDTGFTC